MQYTYTARNAEGQLVRGRVDAPDVHAALAGLHGRPFFLTSLEPSRAWAPLQLPAIGSRRGGRSGIAFFRSLATLVRAGVPLRRGLEISIDRSKPTAFTTELRGVLTDLEHGDSLSAALARRPKAFPGIVIAMVAAGEAAGILDDVLERTATLLERDDAVRKSIGGALAYPAAVLTATLLLVMFLVARVLPTFADLFTSFHVDLPPTTRLLVALGQTAAQPWVWTVLLATTLAAAATGVVIARSDRGRYAVDHLRLNVPVVGVLLRKAVVARFARTLGILVRSGIELSAAIDIVIPVTGSPVHARALRTAARALREGEALTAPLAAAQLFDPLLVALIGVGEETGMLDELLPKAADYLEADVAAAVATLGATIEPALIGTLGIIVGAIVYSVYVPLYSLIGSVAK
jgi:type IV pilus assembly protein PilC